LEGVANGHAPTAPNLVVTYIQHCQLWGVPTEKFTECTPHPIPQTVVREI